MLSGARIWKRFGLTLALYAGLLGAWLIVRWAYRPLFRAGGEFFLGVAAPLKDVELELVPASGGMIAHDTPHMDTVILLKHRQLRGPPAQVPASAFSHAYHPTAILLALFLGATPLDWRVRRRALLVALVLLHLFIGVRLVIPVLYAYGLSNIEGRPLVELPPLLERCFFWAKHFLWDEPAITYLVPAAIWAACAYRWRPIVSAAGA